MTSGGVMLHKHVGFVQEILSTWPCFRLVMLFYLTFPYPYVHIYIYTQYTYSHCIESERVHLLDDPCIEAVHFCVLNYFIYSLWPMLWHLSPRDLPRTYLFLQVLSSSRLGDSMELQWMGRTLGRWKRWHVPWFQISWCRPGTSEGVPKGW